MLVSVIIPVYNAQDHLEQCLRSVLSQTLKDIEIICIDDGSTDSSLEILDQLALEDSRLIVHHVPNGGAGKARNIGLQMAKGKYVALIGHDDLWKSDKLEKQVAFMEEHMEHSVCFSWVDIIDEEKNVINDSCETLYNLFCRANHSQDYWNRKLVLDGNQFCAPSACIRRELLERSGYYRYGLVQLQDYDLWLRLLKEGPMYVLQEKLVLYRKFLKSDKNLSSANRKNLNRDSHERQWICDTLINQLKEQDFARIFCQDMINPHTIEKKEIMCEKVLFLWKRKNAYAVKRFIELVEDEECREILEEKYNVSLLDFYEWNTETIVMDTSLEDVIQEQKRIIEAYQQEQK